MATITEEEELPIVLMPTVPLLKYHGAPLHFMSQPGLSQREYEQKIMTERPSAIDDDVIDVLCPDLPDGNGRQFRMRRSSLSRSPAFAKFFRSPHYLEGCNMQITFLSDPAACFQIARNYLNEGPDMYNMARLRLFVTVNYRVVDRFIILVRLHLLAKKLALPGLMDMAYDTMVEGERLITPTSCITIASVVFSKNAGFTKLLKDWCVNLVRHHLMALKNIEEWYDALEILEPELSEQWNMLLDINSAILAFLDEEASKRSNGEEAPEEAVSDMSNEGHENAVTIIEKQDLTVEELIKQVREEEPRSSEDGWENVEQLVKEDQTLSHSKAREVLGIDAFRSMEPEGKTEPATGSKAIVTRETAKARSLMGLDGNYGRVTWSGHTLRSNRASKLFKFLNFADASSGDSPGSSRS